MTIFWGGLAITPSAAMIQRQEETTRQILLQSRQSIRDRHKQTWQVLLFKRWGQNTIQDILKSPP